MGSMTRANGRPDWQTLNMTRDTAVNGGQNDGRSGGRPQSLRVIQGGAGRPPAEPAAAPEERLARVIYMASVGGYMAVHHGRLVEVNGRMIWPTAESLAADARTLGIVASTMVINTARG